MKKASILTLFGFLTSAISASPEIATEPHDAPQPYMLNLHSDSTKSWSAIKTLGSGITIGALTGLFCYGLESSTPCPWYFSWILSRLARKSLLSAVTDDVEKGGYEVNQEILYESAWVADWSTYFALMATMKITTVS